MKKLIALSSIIFLVKCSTGPFIQNEYDAHLYAPVNEVECVPDKEKEFVFKANTTNGANISLQTNLSYGITNKFCANYNAGYSSLVNTQSLSLGYYGRKGYSENRFLKNSIHLGFAHCFKTSSYQTEDNGQVTGRYNKYFIQNNVEYKTKSISYNLGLAGSIIDWTGFTLDIVDNEVYFPNEFSDNDPFITGESYLRVRYIKSFYGIDIGFNYILLQSEPEPRFQKYALTTGFYLNIYDLLSEIKSQKPK